MTESNLIPNKLPPLQKTEFYSLGKETKDPSLHFSKENKGFKDTSGSIYERNYMKNNINVERENHFLTTNKVYYQKKPPIIDTNNYLNPLGSINNGQRPSNNHELLNSRLFNIRRSKNYALNIDSSLEGASSLNLKEYIQKRDNSSESGIQRSHTVERSFQLDDKPLTFDKNHKIIFKYPPEYLKIEGKEKQSRTKISAGSPEWFHVINKSKMKEFNEKLNKEDTLFIISRYQSWITVTPKNKNRKRPLEKMKVANMEEVSKVVPNWMQIKHANKPVDTMKSKDYKSQRGLEKLQKVTMLVDRDQFNKSIFSIGDFRHNLATKELADEYSSHVSRSPKEFLTCRENDRVFHPRFKTDANLEKIEKKTKEREEFNKKYEERFKKTKTFEI